MLIFNATKALWRSGNNGIDCGGGLSMDFGSSNYVAAETFYRC